MIERVDLDRVDAENFSLVLVKIFGRRWRGASVAKRLGAAGRASLSKLMCAEPGEIVPVLRVN